LLNSYLILVNFSLLNRVQITYHLNQLLLITIEILYLTIV